MSKAISYDAPVVGCYVDESAGSADECNRRTIEFAQGYGFKCEELTVPDDGSDGLDDYSQALSEAAVDAVDYLNGLESRPFMSWLFEDNSLYLLADVDGAREQVDFVSSKTQEYPPDDYAGEWLHVGDHGNAALYVREGGEDREIWGVV